MRKGGFHGKDNLMGIDNLLLRDAALRRLARPSTRVHRNFMDFMYTEHPFSDDDERFVYHEHDFVTLEEHEESWLDEFMHRLVGHCKIASLRVSPLKTIHDTRN